MIESRTKKNTWNGIVELSVFISTNKKKMQILDEEEKKMSRN